MRTLIFHTQLSQKNINNSNDDILMENYIGGTISAVIQRQAFTSVGGFDLSFKAREEYDLWIRLIMNGLSFDIVEEPLAIAYRSLNKRKRISVDIDNYIDAVDKLNQKYEYLIVSRFNDKKKRIRKKMQYEFLAAQAASIGLRKEAIKYYARSLLTIPNLKSCIGLVVSIISPILLIKVRAKF